MWHVAEETRLARVASDHFGPAVPALRAHAGKEEVQHRGNASAPTQPCEHAHVAPLVRRVVLPIPAAVRARLRFAPVALEGVPQKAVWQIAHQVPQLSRWLQRDGGGGRIEVAEFRAAGDEIDAVRGDAGANGGVEVAAEAVALLRPLANFVRFVQDLRDFDRAVVAGQHPEVVPVRMLGVRGIAFVADRGWHQAAEHSRCGLLAACAALAFDQAVRVGDRRGHVWP